VRIWDEYRRKEGLVFVLSGPSGVGKDVVLSEFLHIGSGVKKCVTCTTRPRRDNEVDGVDYTFLTVDEFEARKAECGFLETAVYCDHLYGTPKQWVEQETSLGNYVILKIEVQGGSEIRLWKPDSIMIFLVPPSMEELERRLRDRRTDSEEQIQSRLAQARKELEETAKYDYVIENDSICRAARELWAIVDAERNRIRPDLKARN